MSFIPRMRELKNSVWGCVLVMLALGKQTWVDPLGSQASQPASLARLVSYRQVRDSSKDEVVGT